MPENLRLRTLSRNSKGKGSSRKMRQAGNIPGVVYGREVDPVAILVPGRDLLPLLQLPDVETELISLTVDDGEPMDVLVKEAQFDHIGQRLLHVDFFRIVRGMKLVVDVPVVVIGTATGVKKGGMLQSNMRLAKIRCLPKDLIHQIHVDVTELDVGDSVHIRDLHVPENIEILDEPRRTVVTVLAKRVEVVEAEEEVPEAEEAGPDETAAE